MHENIKLYIEENYNHAKYTRLGVFEGQECYKISLAEDEDWLDDNYYLLFDEIGNLTKTIFAGGQFIDEETDETKLATAIKQAFKNK